MKGWLPVVSQRARVGGGARREVRQRGAATRHAITLGREGDCGQEDGGRFGDVALASSAATAPAPAVLRRCRVNVATPVATFY
jgi:hypothetical protein